MKNYEEMAKLVLEARDEYVKKKKNRVLFLKRASVVTFGAAAVLGIGIFTHAMKPPKKPTAEQSGIILNTTEAVTTSAEKYVQTTIKTVITQKQSTDTTYAQTPPNTTSSNSHTAKQTASAITIALTTSIYQSTSPTTVTIIDDNTQSSTESIATEFATEPSSYDPYELANRFLRFTDTKTNTQYTKTSIDVSPDSINRYLYTIRLTEKTSIDEAEYECDTAIFSLNGIATEAMIAVRYGSNDKYTLYRNQEYQPDTFYELIDSLAIDKYAQLQSIEYYDKKDGGKLYELHNNGDNEFRKVLSNNHDAESVDYYSLLPDDINPDVKIICSYMDNNSFTITFGISSNGYLTTNVTGKGMAYHIGENNAEEFLEMITTNLK